MQNARGKKNRGARANGKKKKGKKKKLPEKGSGEKTGDHCLFARSAMPRMAANSTEATGQTIQVISHRPEIKLQAR